MEQDGVDVLSIAIIELLLEAEEGLMVMVDLIM
jgi:hypothetical protein